MSDTSVTSPRREATRQKLLDAAAQVFAEVGLDAASVEAVCDRAGFTRGAFYSNFETKDELFLELAARVSRERVSAVRARVAELERDGAFADVPANALQIVQQVLDMSADDRLGVLLMSEIRIHALRTPALAAAYLAQTEEMLESVAQIIDDIGRAEAFTFRLEPLDAARLMLTVWEGAAVRSVMAGADQAQLQRATNEELARVAQLLIEPSGD
ncbi:TetR/AcrR family transcriptional regulator [Microbacterium flavescens]|uniref:TetR/AcrR family transcriptional regulator n=1 Tax=Microbacterium flavescens TaxID=69366 RepID=UPI001BDF2B6B|nr:TetR family transcriptional regulator [Microbacterium flavescens]BFF10288.1 TetR/AcrR family transcriptional regulator [Microbacterium flavescens]